MIKAPSYMDKDNEICGVLLNWITAVPEVTRGYNLISQAEVNLSALQELIALQVDTLGLQIHLSVANYKVRQLEACIRGDKSVNYTQELVFATGNDLLKAAVYYGAIEYTDLEGRRSRFDEVLVRLLTPLLSAGAGGPQ